VKWPTPRLYIESQTTMSVDNTIARSYTYVLTLALDKKKWHALVVLLMKKKWTLVNWT